jgi:hypothetical protein
MKTTIIFKHKANIFILLFTLVLIIMFIGDYYDSEFTLHDILVEFHGLVFDILFLGIIYSYYENKKEKKELILRYKTIINNFRGLKSKKTPYKILSCIKELQKLGVTKFNLKNCDLNNIKLKNYYLTYSNFEYANLRSAELENLDLKFSNMKSSNLCDTKLFDIDFNYSDFIDCNLSDSFIDECNFTKAKFCGANFENARIYSNCNFQGADMRFVELNNACIYYCDDWFGRLIEQEVIGIEQIIEIYYTEYNKLTNRCTILKKTSHNPR